MIEKKIRELADTAKIIQKYGPYYVFFDYSGHVNSIQIYIASKTDYLEHLYDETIYLDVKHYRSEECIIDSIDEVIDELGGFIYDTY